MGFRSTRQHKVQNSISQNMYCMYSISAKSRRVQFALCVVLIENYSLLIVFFQYSYQSHARPFFLSMCLAEYIRLPSMCCGQQYFCIALCDLLSYYVFFPTCYYLSPFSIPLSTIKLFCAFIFIHNLSAHFDDTCDTLKLESYC